MSTTEKNGWNASLIEVDEENEMEFCFDNIEDFIFSWNKAMTKKYGMKNDPWGREWKILALTFIFIISLKYYFGLCIVMHMFN